MLNRLSQYAYSERRQENPYKAGGSNQYRLFHFNWQAAIHPRSSLVGLDHQWIVHSTFVYSHRQYLQTVTAIEPEWLIVSPVLICCCRALMYLGIQLPRGELAGETNKRWQHLQNVVGQSIF